MGGGGGEDELAGGNPRATTAGRGTRVPDDIVMMAAERRCLLRFSLFSFFLSLLVFAFLSFLNLFP